MLYLLRNTSFANHPREQNKLQNRSMSIMDWLYSFGIPFNNDSSQNQNNQNSNGKTDFKILLGVY
jgi:hypothetical protein